MTSKKLQVWIEGAIVAALAITLSLVPTNIGSSFTVSLGMIPLTLYAIRRGVKAGLYAGLLWGILHFLTGISLVILSVPQFLIEYLIAFTFAGFAGLFQKTIKETIKEGNPKKLAFNLILAVFVGTLARFFWHFVAGVIFWGAYAQWGMSPLLFSFVMNGVSGLATAVVTALVVVAIVEKFPQLVVV